MPLISLTGSIQKVGAEGTDPLVQPTSCVTQQNFKKRLLNSTTCQFRAHQWDIFEPRLEETKHHKTKKDTYHER
jgi:hypothetical protein